MLALEQNPGARDPIHAIFRAFHTIKGIAGFLEFQEIREVSHETETLLEEARNGRLEPGPAVIDIILESADFLGREIQRIEAGGGPPAAGTEALEAKIRSVMAAGAIDPDLAALAAAVAPVLRRNIRPRRTGARCPRRAGRARAGPAKRPPFRRGHQLGQGGYRQARFPGRHGRGDGDRAIAGAPQSGSGGPAQQPAAAQHRAAFAHHRGSAERPPCRCAWCRSAGCSRR